MGPVFGLNIEPTFGDFSSLLEIRVAAFWLSYFRLLQLIYPFLQHGSIKDETIRHKYRNTIGKIIIIMATFGQICNNIIWKIGLIALLIFPLQIGLIKSRFHYLKISKLEMSMMSGFSDLLLMAFIGRLMALLANESPNSWIHDLINIIFG